MKYSLGREPQWNAGRRARFDTRAPQRQLRRLAVCAYRRSASFSFFVLSFLVRRPQPIAMHPDDPLPDFI
jgi:hypothetical protein